MAIQFFEDKKIFHLSTPDTSYVFMITNGGNLTPLHYGAKIENIEGTDITYPYGEQNEKGYFFYPGQVVTSEELPQEYPTYGNTDFRKPAFHARYKDGSRITKLEYVSHKIFKGKPKLEGLPASYVENDNEADTLEITVKDKLTGLELVYRYTAYNNENLITRSVTANNKGNDDVNILAMMSMNFDFYGNDFDFIHLTGYWSRERHIERVPINHTEIKISSYRGISSHVESPFFALARKNTNEAMGDVYGFGLVYSGSFEAGVEIDYNEVTRAYIGISSFDFNWLLKPDESLTVPEVMMVFSSKGIGDMSRTFQKMTRTRVCRGKYRDIERPVLINNWEATYFDFTEDKIVEIAKTAKEVGIELMVLDDGWFGKRDNDRCALGDWYPNLNKIPSGITGLAKKVNDIGMQFGLWFEPEMVSPDSDLYRAHPDWCIHVKDRERNEGRNQLTLDLSREDVQEFIIDFMTKTLGEASISYVKWDCNKWMYDMGSALLPPERQGEIAYRYVLGLYRVLEVITQRFPDVLFEGCCGGGGRFDLGMLHYFIQYWTSDDTDAMERMYIQEGTSMYLPSSTMGAHVSTVPNHQVHRVSPLKTRGNTAMCGQFGYELDITKMPQEELDEVKEQIKFYKSIRNVIHRGDMYRICSPVEGNNVVWEYISEDKETVVVYAAILHFISRKLPSRIRLQGLDENAMYKNRETGEVLSGAVLNNCGYAFTKNLMCDFDSQMFVFDKVKA